MDFTIVHHHVGARGNVAMPLRGDSPLRQDMAFYYYDADADALNAGLRGGSLSDVLDSEAIHMIRTFETADHKASAVAFVEKRAPSFQGR